MANRLSQTAYRKIPAVNKKDKLIFIVGPTGVGKTEAALELAKRLNAEIISCDSMQVYKNMNILASQPPLALRRRARHHLVDIIPPTREYNVFRYRREAMKKIQEIIGRKKTPLFTGGAGLYMSVLIDGIFEAKAKDKARAREIREKLSQEIERAGSEKLYQRLLKVDTAAAGKIHPNDKKRILRALEVFEITGQPISELQQQRKGLTDKYEIKIFCLDMERDELYRRIEERVERMFEQGLVNEVSSLLKLKLSRTASCGIGIKELQGYFSGLYGLEEAKALMKRNSRLYAKRQISWFRKDKRIKWVKIKDKERPQEVANRIWKELC